MTKTMLTIAASDPSGGAGIEADIKVASAHNVFALSAITAITVQDSSGVRAVHPTDPSVFLRTLELLADDRQIHAIKIGALATTAHIEAVRDFLSKLTPLPPVVLDPVLSATTGAVFLPHEALPMITKSLLPFVALITPNLNEAGLLTEIEVTDKPSMHRAAQALCEMGADAALVKGGHLKLDSSDVLALEGRTMEWPNNIIPHEFHGTGCALSSAITAQLAKGTALEQAVGSSRDYLRLSMSRARPGRGKAYILDFPSAQEK